MSDDCTELRAERDALKMYLDQSARALVKEQVRASYLEDDLARARNALQTIQAFTEATGPGPGDGGGDGEPFWSIWLMTREGLASDAAKDDGDRSIEFRGTPQLSPFAVAELNRRRATSPQGSEA